MKRIWRDTISPKWMHDTLGIFHGYWMPQMDRCWISDDGYQVMSRLLRTEWGKVEHVTISYVDDKDLSFSFNGERDIHWQLSKKSRMKFLVKIELQSKCFQKKRAR